MSPPASVPAEPPDDWLRTVPVIPVRHPAPAAGARPVDRARGVLVTVFGIDAEEAVHTLLWVSRQAGVTVSTVAERFLADVAAPGAGGATREDVIHVLAVLATRGPEGPTFRRR